MAYYSGSESESSITTEFASHICIMPAACAFFLRLHIRNRILVGQGVAPPPSPQLRALPHPSRSSSDALQIPCLLPDRHHYKSRDVTFSMSKMDVNDPARWRASFQTRRRKMYGHGQVRSSRVRSRMGNMSRCEMRAASTAMRHRGPANYLY